MALAHVAIARESLPPGLSDELNDGDLLALEYARLRDELGAMEVRIHKSDQRRIALLHLIGDFNADRKSVV